MDKNKRESAVGRRGSLGQMAGYIKDGLTSRMCSDAYEEQGDAVHVDATQVIQMKKLLDSLRLLKT